MKKAIVIALSLILALSGMLIYPVSAAAKVWDGISVSSSLSGSGTSADPYIVATGADFALIRKEINSGNVLYSAAIYKQTGDIDLNGYNVKPIGPTNTAGAFFSGTYDGGGYTISNFVVSSNEKYAGLFGYVECGYIQNLKVTGASVSSSSGESSSAVGIIVGYINTGAYVSGCSTGADCYVEAINMARVGGVVGWNYSSTIENCLNRATVVFSGAAATYIGGITSTIGKDGAVIKNCINIGTVISQSGSDTNKILAGGITGLAGGSSGANEIIECYNTGTIANICEFTTTEVGIGGICGFNQKAQASLNDCYNAGSIYATSGKFNNDKNYLGSIIGFTTAGNTTSTTYCYSLTQIGVVVAGDVAASNNTLVSSVSNTIKNSSGNSVKFSEALAAIDAAVSKALGVASDWSESSYNLESAAGDIADATSLQTQHIALIENAPDEGEAKTDGTTAADTAPVTSAPVSQTSASTEAPEPAGTTAATTVKSDVTTAPAVTTAGENPQKGCGSVLVTGAALIFAVSGAAAIVLGKKRRTNLK